MTPSHNMLKEIYEQPDAVRRTIASLEAGLEFGLMGGGMRSVSRIVIAASGTSRHAGMAGKVMLESLAGIPVDVEYASEFQYSSTALDQVLTIIVTQSGETADTLAALRRAKANGAKVLAISNVAESSVVREADAAIHTKAGVEVAIPSTKAFSAQLAAFYLLSVSLAMEKRRISTDTAHSLVRDIQAVPEMIRRCLLLEDHSRKLAADLSRHSDFIFAGRGVHTSVAMDGALKLKEVAYLHAEGFPTGEIPHGPLALMDGNFVAFVIAAHDPSSRDAMTRYRSTLLNMQEIRKRGAKVIAVGIEGDDSLAEIADDRLLVPAAPDFLLPLLEIVPLQLFAYHAAVLKGIDVDRPRHLTKAVLSQ